MKVVSTNLTDVLIVEPVVHQDERGFFYEVWNELAFNETIGYPISFVQDNHSCSAKGVLRGLHFQNPNPQGKLVRCTRGSVWDVAVDIRRSSENFLSWTAVELTEDNRLQLWIPPGFAHGFLVQSGGTELQYKATAHYHPAADRVVAWDDPRIGIDWPLASSPIVSDKDQAAPDSMEALLYD